MPGPPLAQLPTTARGLADEGYAVLEGFLERTTVAALRREVEIALQAPEVPGCERPHNRLVPLRWSDRAVQLILESSGARRSIAATAGGRDLRWISGYVSVREPCTPALWWHQDWWCWDHPVSLRREAAQVALLCYLSDTKPGNGALRVIPRSHLGSVALHAALPEAHALGEELPPDHEVLADHPDAVTVAARAGDAVLLDYRLLHGTHANASDERRDCVLLSFTPSWCDLPRDVRAHLIQHLAQPRPEERTDAAWEAELLPTFAGKRADLELNRVAPARFAVRA